MTDLQKQNLTSLIKTSPILDDQERGEWLMLLDLMNDKQAGELERILKPAVVAPPPAAPAKPASAFVPPPPRNLPLNHIVNLPKPQVFKPAPEKTFSKFAEHLNKILAEKDLPASETQKVLPPPPVKPMEQPRPITQQIKPVAAPVSVKLQDPADAAQLQPQQWVGGNHATITQTLKAIISKSGYHEVIFNLQKSPLYALYIDTGLKSLESPKRFEALGQNYLNKKQFEDFTDLLRELQV